MACRLDLAEIRVLSVRLRLENIDIDNVSVHQLIQGNWLMSCSCKVLDVKVGHVHNGLTLISSLVWWRTRCPRKWRKSRKGNPICCSLLSYKKQIFEMLLLLSCVFKSVRLFDVIYSEIKALCASEYIVWIELLWGLQRRAFKLLWFEGACQHIRITQQHVRAAAQIGHFEYHAAYTFRCPSACLRSYLMVCSLHRVATKQLCWVIGVV